MMSLSQIHELSREIAVEAAAAHREPVVFEEEDRHDEKFRIPNIGDYRPKGYRLVKKYFVDKSGWGREDEPALTIDNFRRAMKAGRYYAIIEEGQFQVFVGEFVKREPRQARHLGNGHH